MSVHVVWNTIKDPVKRVVFERAVLEVLRPHTHEGHWDVKLTESGALPGWTAVVVAPQGTKVAWYFHDEEDTPELVTARGLRLSADRSITVANGAPA